MGLSLIKLANRQTNAGRELFWVGKVQWIRADRLEGRLTLHGTTSDLLLSNSIPFALAACPTPAAISVGTWLTFGVSEADNGAVSVTNIGINGLADVGHGVVPLPSPRRVPLQAPNPWSNY